MGDELRMIEMGVSKGRTTYIVAHEQGYQQRSQPFYASQITLFVSYDGTNLHEITILHTGRIKNSIL